MSTIEARLETIENKFRRGSKSYEVARWVVRQNRDVIPDIEKETIAKEFGLSTSTISGVFTKMRALGLYGDTLPPLDIPSIQTPPQLPPPSQYPLTPHTPTPNSMPPNSQEYATREDLERIEEAILSLSSLINGDNSEDDDDDSEDDYQEPRKITEQPQAILEESSMKQMGTWIFAKNLLYYDFARQGAFGGALDKFDGNWSDFVNIIIEDYFVRTSNVGIGLLSRRFA